jgi:hypothetical protein
MMTQRDDSVAEPDDDALLRATLECLKQIEPPLQARIASRIAVAAELGPWRSANAFPWWRRSISVPIPVAASLLVAAALLLAVGMHGWARPTADATPDRPAERDTSAGEATRAVAQGAPRRALKYSETETYLCGVGRLHSESRFSVEE